MLCPNTIAVAGDVSLGKTPQSFICLKIVKPALIRDNCVYEEAQSTRVVLASRAVSVSGVLALLAGLAELFMAARRDQPARGVGVDQFQRGQTAEGDGRGGFDYRRLLD